MIFAAILPLLAGVVNAQSSKSFEVASLTPSAPGTRGVAAADSPGRIIWMNVTVENLLHLAFEKMPHEFVGVPRWVTDDRYTLRATASTDATQHEINLMVRSLLEERFQLRTHSETRVMPVYDLLIARGGPKLRVAIDSDPAKGGGMFTREGVTQTFPRVPISSVLSRSWADSWAPR